jgi:hypothetical protein
VVTGTNFVKLNGGTNDVDASQFTIVGDDGATYTLTDTADAEITSATSFTLSLSATDKYNVESVLNTNGSSSDDSTTYNFQAADNWMAGAASSTDISDTTSNAITVSNLSGPAITSASYDASTGVLVVTGTNFVSKVGASDVAVSTLTLTGEGGSTYTLTSSDIEITSATSFSLTVNTADKLNINGLLNKDGSSSDDATTYNFAAADNWLSGAAASTDIADTTNAITVSNVAVPTLTSASYDASTGVLTVTGTSLVNKPGSTNDIDVSALSITGEGGNT